jgi:hypothetical protein
MRANDPPTRLAMMAVTAVVRSNIVFARHWERFDALRVVWVASIIAQADVPCLRAPEDER